MLGSNPLLHVDQTVFVVVVLFKVAQGLHFAIFFSTFLLFQQVAAKVLEQSHLLLERIYGVLGQSVR